MVRFIPGLGGSRQPDSPRNPGQSISGQLAFWLGRATFGASVHLGSIDVTPVVHAGPFGDAPVLLHDAIASGELKMMERRARAER